MIPSLILALLICVPMRNDIADGYNSPTCRITVFLVVTIGMAMILHTLGAHILGGFGHAFVWFANLLRS